MTLSPSCCVFIHHESNTTSRYANHLLIFLCKHAKRFRFIFALRDLVISHVKNKGLKARRYHVSKKYIPECAQYDESKAVKLDNQGDLTISYCEVSQSNILIQHVVYFLCFPLLCTLDQSIYFQMWALWKIRCGTQNSSSLHIRNQFKLHFNCTFGKIKIIHYYLAKDFKVFRRYFITFRFSTY